MIFSLSVLRTSAVDVPWVNIEKYNVVKKVLSTQRGVPFVFCPSPITIDKTADWGEGNFQKAPNGAFLKMKDATTVSHLVQPNKDKSAPIGWNPTETPGVFDKKPIWVSDKVLKPGTIHPMDTADGPIKYKVEEPSRVCYNDLNGEPDMNDGWVQKESDLRKNYEFEG